MIQIKKAETKDADNVRLLARQTFTETFENLFSKNELEEYINQTFDLGKLHRSLTKKENIYRLLYYNNRLIGYYKLKLNSNQGNISCLNPIQLQKIYILKEFLNRKFGALLLKDILSLTEIKTCDLIWLVVLNSNVRAIRFYEKNNFVRKEIIHYKIGRQNLEYDVMIRKGLNKFNNINTQKKSFTSAEGDFI